jgi:hypothetical protein
MRQRGGRRGERPRTRLLLEEDAAAYMKKGAGPPIGK